MIRKTGTFFRSHQAQKRAIRCPETESEVQDDSWLVPGKAFRKMHSLRGWRSAPYLESDTEVGPV
mgnify:CR=1 FL=1|jgi:hypothetical protein